mgnify:CR=1 FL=1
MENEIHDQSVLTEKQINKIKVRLHEVHHAICHWTDKERVAKNYLAQRLEEQAKLQKQLNYQAELLNDIQSEEEQADAKLLFAECEQIDPSECDAYDLDPTDKVEVHKCKATGWHYLYDPTAEVCPYYCCITINSGEFDTLEQLQKWARPLYFQ